MKIALIEPFFGGSHQAWANGLMAHSKHEFKAYTLPSRHWKWRMHGGAVTLAEKFSADSFRPDLILATDMLDLSTFLTLSRPKSNGIPVAVYFHENQISYPWSPSDPDPKLGRDNHYGWLNYTTALAADQLFFNSQYHLNSFLESLEIFLRAFPDRKNLHLLPSLREKSEVLPLGMNLKKFDPFFIEKPEDEPPVLLWNHRWEYDKAPEAFFSSLFQLADEGVDFRLIVTGEQFGKQPAIFEEAKKKLSQQLIHFGYVPDFEAYAKLLWQADILPVTSIQDFFGGSVVEAIYCQTVPLLPNRLAYPGHIPSHLHDSYLYSQPKDLIVKLKALIKQIGTGPETSSWVAAYDWNTCIGQYDQKLNSTGQFYSKKITR